MAEASPSAPNSTTATVSHPLCRAPSSARRPRRIQTTETQKITIETAPAYSEYPWPSSWRETEGGEAGGRGGEKGGTKGRADREVDQGHAELSYEDFDPAEEGETGPTQMINSTFFCLV